jgi:hypothetical protein
MPITNINQTIEATRRVTEGNSGIIVFAFV